jgi:23S rRNA pseudouridine1911/1915/1917 synthase
VDEIIEMISEHEDSGIRLDCFLTRHFPISRSCAARLIDDGIVQVDGSTKRPSFKLKAGMHIQGTYRMDRGDEPLAKSDIPLEILYEDQWIVAIDKPAGLMVHPGAGNQGQTLVNALLARYPSIAAVGEPDRPGIVHRLDKMTSGVMVAALDANAYAALVHAFKAHEQTREYSAVCYGHMPATKGTIETFIQRNPKDRKRMTSKLDEGRKAITHWEIMKQWKEFSQLLLRLETGRTHQIRVHLCDMGHPVVGDPQYGGRKRANSIANHNVRSYVKTINRQMLHATALGIRHPVTGIEMEFKSPLAHDIEELIITLDQRDNV